MDAGYSMEMEINMVSDNSSVLIDNHTTHDG